MFWFLVSYSRFLFPGFWSRFQVSCSRFLFPGSWFLALVSGSRSRFQALRSWFLCVTPVSCLPPPPQLDDGRSFPVRMRIDTDVELTYFLHGGILNYMIRKMALG